MKDIANFIAGCSRSQEKHFSEERELFEQLRQGQRRKGVIMACTDSRVDPALLTGAGPGDVFAVRYVANPVPPYEPGGSFASVPAALEFAVLSLAVGHVIVVGHAQCRGIHALMSGSGAGGELQSGMQRLRTNRRPTGRSGRRNQALAGVAPPVRRKPNPSRNGRSA